MNEDRLKTAVLGLNESGQLLLTAASQTNYFQIQAVADKDAQLAEKLATEYKCIAYDDYRQLIIQNQFDSLLVAAGVHSCDEHIRTAMKKKFNVLKLAPPARNFEEATEFVQLAEEENKFSSFFEVSCRRSQLEDVKFLLHRCSDVLIATMYASSDQQTIELILYY